MVIAKLNKIIKNFSEEGYEESPINKRLLQEMCDKTDEIIDVTNSNEADLVQNGYQKFASGLILQWGVADITLTSTEVATEITFPIPFSKTCFQVNATLNDAGALNTILTSNVACNAFSRTGASLQVKSTSNYAKDKNIKAYWFAIGQ